MHNLSALFLILYDPGWGLDIVDDDFLNPARHGVSIEDEKMEILENVLWCMIFYSFCVSRRCCLVHDTHVQYTYFSWTVFYSCPGQ